MNADATKKKERKNILEGFLKPAHVERDWQILLRFLFLLLLVSMAYHAFMFFKDSRIDEEVQKSDTESEPVDADKIRRAHEVHSTKTMRFESLR